MNIGILTGKLSNLIVVDIDKESALTELKKQGEIPKTAIIKTTYGYHYYFRFNTKALRNTLKFFPGIDSRGEGGFVLSPESIHPSGKKYYWLVSPEEQPIATIPEWLETLIEHKMMLKKKKGINKRKKGQKEISTSSKTEEQHNALSEPKTQQWFFNKSLRMLKKKIPSLIIKRGIDPTSSHNEANKMFPERERRIHWIMWDWENELKRRAGQEFYISFGIMLNKSKNREKMFGQQIQSHLKKCRIEVVYSDNNSSIMRIILTPPNLSPS